MGLQSGGIRDEEHSGFWPQDDYGDRIVPAPIWNLITGLPTKTPCAVSYKSDGLRPFAVTIEEVQTVVLSPEDLTQKSEQNIPIRTAGLVTVGAGVATIGPPSILRKWFVLDKPISFVVGAQLTAEQYDKAELFYTGAQVVIECDSSLDKRSATIKLLHNGKVYLDKNNVEFEIQDPSSVSVPPLVDQQVIANIVIRIERAYRSSGKYRVFQLEPVDYSPLPLVSTGADSALGLSAPFPSASRRESKRLRLIGYDNSGVIKSMSTQDFFRYEREPLTEKLDKITESVTLDQTWRDKIEKEHKTNKLYKTGFLHFDYMIQKARHLSDDPSKLSTIWWPIGKGGSIIVPLFRIPNVGDTYTFFRDTISDITSDTDMSLSVIGTTAFSLVRREEVDGGIVIKVTSAIGAPVRWGTHSFRYFFDIVYFEES